MTFHDALHTPLPADLGENWTQPVWVNAPENAPNAPNDPLTVGRIEFGPLPSDTIDRIRPTPLMSHPTIPTPASDNLTAALEGAFTSSGLSVGDLTLRPFSLGTLSLCRRLNLDMITGDRPADQLTEDEKQMQIVAFIFIQSRPLLEVLRAVKDPDFMTNHILPFAMDLPMDALPKAIAELQRVMDQASAAFVEVSPKPEDRAESAPPNC